MIPILSCDNTCPHGGLRSPWIPWDMGPGQGHMSHGLGPTPLGRGARRGVKKGGRRPGTTYPPRHNNAASSRTPRRAPRTKGLGPSP